MSRARKGQRMDLARRIREIRLERFGDDVEMLATALALPPRTWLEYEAGAELPAEVMLRFIELTGTSFEWLLTGQGPRSDDLALDVEKLMAGRRGLGPLP